ncbi:triose-phosphate isomerase [Acidihalobacter yilgarnensis]|uniref:Triosephosphate isomerase n=1 Tax=Acidihalobacter yilgarnensis TaxID=2819280 RepID=A0A1D8IM95_9GAMM|nr:triose-phosphate isomerase [Acidihalobacter yilgarnensis]AOU97531.1 triose-phosphate isomerase [Acidihalobacter yilgarnensis]
MRQPMVAGNWKLNGSRQMVSALLGDILSGLGDPLTAEIAICPPFVYLQEARGALEGSGVVLGAQDVCDEDEGAYTGEVSAPMLGDVGCRYVIVGHSERRSLYRETDELVARKFEAVMRAGLCPILCVGESLEERNAGVTEAVVARQLDAVVELVGPERIGEAVVAYEPVWAIGTGMTASPEQAQAVHAYIRGRLDLAGVSAGSVRLLYGGSVKPENAVELFAMPDIDGGLIGGASLQAETFLAICRAA